MDHLSQNDAVAQQGRPVREIKKTDKKTSVETTKVDNPFSVKQTKS